MVQEVGVHVTRVPAIDTCLFSRLCIFMSETT